MDREDYEKFYKKGGTYEIPTEIFNELLDEYEEKIKKLEERYLTRSKAYNSILLENTQLKENHKLTGYEIINELEKWLKEEAGNSFYPVNYLACICMTLQKIELLKGSDK